MKFIFSLALMPVLALAVNTENPCVHLTYGQPKVSDQVFCRAGYALGYNHQLKSAEWVSYELYKEITPGVARQNDFRVDPQIPVAYQTTPADYREPVYHMGHLANSESIDQSIVANSETFYMSNMVPQLPGHNTAIWKGLENRERKWANKRGKVIVIAGPVYTGAVDTIGDQVPVPSDFFKIIFDPKKQEAIAYYIPHKKLKTKQLDQFLVSIDEIEQRLQFDFLAELEDNLEVAIEKIIQDKQW